MRNSSHDWFRSSELVQEVIFSYVFGVSSGQIHSVARSIFRDQTVTSSNLGPRWSLFSPLRHSSAVQPAGILDIYR